MSNFNSDRWMFSYKVFVCAYCVQRMVKVVHKYSASLFLWDWSGMKEYVLSKLTFKQITVEQTRFMCWGFKQIYFWLLVWNLKWWQQLASFTVTFSWILVLLNLFPQFGDKHSPNCMDKPYKGLVDLISASCILVSVKTLINLWIRMARTFFTKVVQRKGLSMTCYSFSVTLTAILSVTCIIVKCLKLCFP